MHYTMMRGFVIILLLLVGIASVGKADNGAITSFNLVNDGSSSVTTVLSPVFGLQFKKGDISRDQWPAFFRHDNGSACVYSQGMKRTWSDGSLKHLTVLVRCLGPIAGHSTLQIDVASAGGPPTTSARTITELSDAAIATVGVGAFNLKGRWTATLSDGSSSAKKWLDGDAGAGWVIDVDFKQNGRAHGQLKERYYAVLTTDGSGKLGGIRFMPRIWQPYYDIDTRPKGDVAFSSLAVQYGDVPTTITWQWPYNSSTFTQTTATTITAPSANFYSGATGGGLGLGTVPVTVSSTGSLPTGLSASTLYYATQTTGSQVLTLYTCGEIGGSCAINMTSAGSGTLTVTPVPALSYFGNLFGADANAKWRYIQGAGSLAADTPLRVTRPQTYWVATKTLAPYDLGLTNVQDNTWGSKYDWTPWTTTTLWPFMGTTGDRDDIGIYNSYQIRAFYNQTADNDKFMRAMGYVSGLFGYSVRQSTTRAPPNVGGAAYTGFGPDVSGSFWYEPGNVCQTGHSCPSLLSLGQGIQPGFDHMPLTSAFSYRLYGTPDYLDLMIEEADIAIYYESYANGHRNQTKPIAVKGITTGLPPQMRGGAWATRELVNTAGFVPDISWDAVDYKSYYMDRAAKSMQWINAVIANANGYWATHGYFTNYSFTLQVLRAPNSWQRGYLVQAVALAAMLIESSDAITALNSFSTWYQHVASTFGYYNNETYQEISATDDAHKVPITSDSLWGGAGGINSFSWTAGTPGTVTISGLNGNSPTNGDKYIFTNGVMDHPGTAPGGLNLLTPYYLVNCSTAGLNGMCNLAAVPQGPALSITNTGSESDVQSIASVVHGDTASLKSLGVAGGMNTYAGAQWMTALGVNGCTGTAADALSRMRASGLWSPAADPKWAMQANF